MNRRLIWVLLFLALGGVSCSHGARRSDVAVSFPSLGTSACEAGRVWSLQERGRQIEALRETIERSLEQTEPNYNYPGGSGADRVFNGNFDWHSSVHAHWALLSIAQATGDKDLARKVLDRLSAQALAAEDRRLKLDPPDPLREMPYGQSWLLLLLHQMRELSRVAPELADNAWTSPEVQELRRATEERVVSFLEQSPFPEGRPKGYAGPSDPAYFSRAHTSWLFAYWLLKMSEPSPSLTARVAGLAKRLEGQRTGILRQTSNEPRDFLYLPAVLWLIDHTSPVNSAASKRSGRYALPPVPAPALPITKANAHQSGAVAVSLWPYAMQSSRGDRASCELFNQQLDALGAHPEFWRFDPDRIETFGTVGHWVPQFIWMAMLLER